VAGPSPWLDRDKIPVKFDIDMLKCIYCGMCEEACPCDAIELTPTYNQVSTSRAEKLYDINKLLSR
jgi:NADH-quinone oxidoreductase subunit I